MHFFLQAEAGIRAFPVTGVQTCALPIGKLVLHCIQKGVFLPDLPLETYKTFSSLFEEDIYEVLRPERVVNARNVYGGTASGRVAGAIERAEAELAAVREWAEKQAERDVF